MVDSGNTADLRHPSYVPSRPDFRENGCKQAKGGTQAEGEVAVLFEITDSGGRDIQAMSLAGGEKEVTLLAGSVYEITSLKLMTAPAKYATAGPDDPANPIKEWWHAQLAPRRASSSAADG